MIPKSSPASWGPFGEGGIRGGWPACGGPSRTYSPSNFAEARAKPRLIAPGEQGPKGPPTPPPAPVS